MDEATKAATQAHIDLCNTFRKEVKATAAGLLGLRDQMYVNSYSGEAIANVILAYRHLEDASMRLGKAIQALDGGTSVYDRETTVGA